MKVAWVVGFGDGGGGNCLEQSNAGPKTLAQSEWAVRVCNNRLVNLPDVTYGQLVKGLDHFYADYRNESIDAPLAFYYVNLELNGAPQSVLDDYARGVRQSLNQ
jgi:hypothetical protein